MDGTAQTEIGQKPKECRICGKTPAIAPEPTAIGIRVETCEGERLEVPGVYCLCVRCRRAVGYAERLSKMPPGGVQ